MEGGKTDVLHFLFAKNEALIGRGIVRLRDISSGHRGSRCTTEQRKTQSGRTQHRHRGGLGCAFLPRSLLDPSHGRILCSCERACCRKFALAERGAQDLPPCHKMKWNLENELNPSGCAPLSALTLSRLVNGYRFVATKLGRIAVARGVVNRWVAPRNGSKAVSHAGTNENRMVRARLVHCCRTGRRTQGDQQAQSQKKSAS
jgi:hypothetical protein